MNDELWQRPDLVAVYASRTLRPPEALLLARYRDDLAGRVLELGCGAGRLTGYLAQLGGDAHGVDVSPAMVDYCRRRYPRARFEVRDLRDLGAYGDASFDAVWASFNVLDVLDDGDRRAVLQEVRRMLAPQGLLLMSSHNRAHVPFVPPPLRWVRSRDPVRFARRAARLPRALRNHRRLRALQREEDGYALVNDEAHDYSLLLYYVTRDAQERQLAEVGFSLVECLDGDGEPVPPGEDAARWPELHYAARPAAVSAS